MTAPMKNNSALTCSSREKLTSVSLSAEISPTQATAMSADVRPVAFWIAAAIPLCADLTADKLTAVRGVMARTIPTASRILPGNTSVTTWNPCVVGRTSSSPNPASAGPVVRKIRGPIRAARPPTPRANRNDRTGLGKVIKPETVAEYPATSCRYRAMASEPIAMPP